MFRRKNPGRPGWLLLALAAFLLLLLAGAQGYVSWQAQYNFIDAAKHAHLPSALEALGLDTGAVIFALLGLAHARMGQTAAIERTLNLACAFGSMTMNLLGANLGSPRSIAVYVLPAVLYAACSDRLIATAGHASGVRETSMWRWVGMTVLYLLRAVVAFPSTMMGFRRQLLELTPLPEADGAEDRRPRHKAPGTTTRRPFKEALDEAVQKFGDDAKRIGYVPEHREIRDELKVGHGRADAIREHLKSLSPGDPERDPDATEVFSAVRDFPPGQPVRAHSFQTLPVTPQ